MNVRRQVWIGGHDLCVGGIWGVCVGVVCVCVPSYLDKGY